MEQDLQHEDSVRYTLEHKLYQEYDKLGNRTYSLKLKHDKSVRFERTESGFYWEYDEWDRTTFWQMPSGSWTLKFYDEPVGDRVNVQPYQVVHSSWHLYNGLER